MAIPLLAVLGKVGAAIGKGAATVGKTVGQAATTAGKAVAQGAKTAGQAVAKGAGQIGTSSFKNALQGGTKAAGETAKSPFVNALTKVQTAYSNIPEWQKNVVSNSLSAIGDYGNYNNVAILPEEDTSWIYQPTRGGYYGY